jgi:hypothetical protein
MLDCTKYAGRRLLTTLSDPHRAASCSGVVPSWSSECAEYQNGSNITSEWVPEWIPEWSNNMKSEWVNQNGVQHQKKTNCQNESNIKSEWGPTSKKTNCQNESNIKSEWSCIPHTCSDLPGTFRRSNALEAEGMSLAAVSCSKVRPNFVTSASWSIKYSATPSWSYRT